VLYGVDVRSGQRTRLLQTVNGPGVYAVSGMDTMDGDGEMTMQSASFSSDGEYAIISETSVQPSSALYAVGANGVSPQLIASLQDNRAMNAALSAYALPSQQFTRLPGVIPGTMLNAYWLFPPGFNGGCDTQYPTVVFVYGGPGSQQVTSAFQVGSGDTRGFHTYLTGALHFIVLVVDGIGTGGQNDSFQKATTYMNLGVNEARDVVNAIAWASTMCFVDSDRVALWGWSYGGFLTSMVATSNSGLLRTAMAVAPVTDWALYDSIYTERYMRTPSENLYGYNISSVLNRVGSIDTDYLLVHGTGDDNVHLQNSAVWVKTLVENNVQFSLMYYTNRDHSLRGPEGQTNQHLYRLLTDHLLRNMDLLPCHLITPEDYSDAVVNS